MEVTVDGDDCDNDSDSSDNGDVTGRILLMH